MQTRLMTAAVAGTKKILFWPWNMLWGPNEAIRYNTIPNTAPTATVIYNTCKDSTLLSRCMYTNIYWPQRQSHSRWYLAAMSVHNIFTTWTHHVNFYRP